MTERRVRHLPVVDGEGVLGGVVSIGDVVKSRLGQLETEHQQLVEYIPRATDRRRPAPTPSERRRGRVAGRLARPWNECRRDGEAGLRVGGPGHRPARSSGWDSCPTTRRRGRSATGTGRTASPGRTTRSASPSSTCRGGPTARSTPSRRGSAPAPPTVRAFEWGSGASTIWLARRVAELHSVEHHAEFGRDDPGAARAARRGPRSTIVEPEASDAPVIGSAKEGHGRLDFSRYVDQIDVVGGTFELIVVDGRAREACLVAGAPPPRR